jgi:putative nucleotidyltransferase with HDIG domain
MARVLVVSSERRRGREVAEVLRREGHHVDLHSDPAGWGEREATTGPEVVVAPVDATAEVLAGAVARTRGFPAPLLLVQRDDDLLPDVDLDHRLVDRIVTPFVREDLLARVDALVRVRRVVLGAAPLAHDEGGGRGWRALGRRCARLFVGGTGRHRAIGPYHEVARRVARWADRRDAFAPGHAERVTALCALMAEPLELDDAQTSTLLRAAMLHDIGKVAVPVEVLHQRTPLDEGQRSMIRTHPRRGATLLRQLGSDDDVARVILHHHEQPDGRGYYRVRPDAVPMPARILAVAEVYDGMTTTRLSLPLPPAQALARLDEMKDVRLDASAVEALAEQVRRPPGSGKRVAATSRS